MLPSVASLWWLTEGCLSGWLWCSWSWSSEVLQCAQRNGQPLRRPRSSLGYALAAAAAAWHTGSSAGRQAEIMNPRSDGRRRWAGTMAETESLREKTTTLVWGLGKGCRAWCTLLDRSGLLIPAGGRNDWLPAYRVVMQWCLQAVTVDTNTLTSAGGWLFFFYRGRWMALAAWLLSSYRESWRSDACTLWRDAVETICSVQLIWARWFSLISLLFIG